MTSESDQHDAPKEVLATELAHVIVTQEDAEALLHVADFPRSRVPSFTTPFTYWLKIVDMADHGLLEDGIRPIARAATTLFPHNEVFARCLDLMSDLRIAPRAARCDDAKRASGTALTNEAIGRKKQQDKRETWNLTLRLDDIPGERLIEVLEVLRRVSGDPSITLIRVDSGSTILVLRMSACTALRIQELLESGEVQEMVGMEISDFSGKENSLLYVQTRQRTGRQKMAIALERSERLVPGNVQFGLDLEENMSLDIRLVGELEVDDVNNLLNNLPWEVMARAKILIDLTGVQSCSRSARRALANLQREFAEFGGRTAFIAPRPRLRGLGLWVAHVAGDANAGCFRTRAQAERWLLAKSAGDKAAAMLGQKASSAED